jgi:hypothetical protein
LPPRTAQRVWIGEGPTDEVAAAAEEGALGVGQLVALFLGLVVGRWIF